MLAVITITWHIQVVFKEYAFILAYPITFWRQPCLEVHRFKNSTYGNWTHKLSFPNFSTPLFCSGSSHLQGWHPQPWGGLGQKAGTHPHLHFKLLSYLNFSALSKCSLCYSSHLDLYFISWLFFCFQLLLEWSFWSTYLIMWLFYLTSFTGPFLHKRKSQAFSEAYL